MFELRLYDLSITMAFEREGEATPAAFQKASENKDTWLRRVIGTSLRRVIGTWLRRVIGIWLRRVIGAWLRRVLVSGIDLDQYVCDTRRKKKKTPNRSTLGNYSIEQT